MGVRQFKHRLKNELTVLGEVHPQAYTVAFALLLPLGSQHDPEALQGIGSVTQDVLFKGAGRWDTKTLAEQIDQIGFQESHHTERELIAFSGTVLPRHLYRALDLLFTVLLEPHLPEQGFEEVRALARHQLLALEDAPAQKMFYQLGQRFFPFPLSNPAEGTLEGLAALNLENVQACHRQYTPQGAILSVAGSFEEDTLNAYLKKRFGDWQGPASSSIQLGPVRRGVEHIDQDSEQMQIGIAHDSIPLSHPDYFKARIGNLALSGGMSSRLFVEVRQKRGLAYSVFATYITTKTFGGVLGYAGTTTERAQETLDVLLNELQRLSQGIDQDELDKAKTRLKTNFIVQAESTRSRAEAMGREFYYANKVWTLDEVMQSIDDLTLADVNRYLRNAKPDAFTILTLGKTAPVFNR